MRLTNETTLEQIEKIAKADPNARVVYGVATCWWKVGDPIYQKDKHGLPCDPRGGLLLECHNLASFLASAKGNLAYYGKHGLDAFMAAYHGNVVTDDGKPTCFKGWDEYNDLIDQDEEFGKLRERANELEAEISKREVEQQLIDEERNAGSNELPGSGSQDGGASEKGD